ncbi:transposase [Micromonospora sp. NPDC049679]|uniref:transposase n=1 Tax=Micromonospora sp. NPDC049679 TaxID=3155920 RepID=UPI00340AD4DA
MHGIPASSGRTDRHRLHRGGDRDANSALWRITLVRMRCHQPTKDYVTRRITEGKTKTEIMRCLKRYIARDAYRMSIKMGRQQ